MFSVGYLTCDNLYINVKAILSFCFPFDLLYCQIHLPNKLVFYFDNVAIVAFDLSFPLDYHTFMI